MYKFLVYGANGWIGSKVYNYLTLDNEVVVIRGNSRVDNVDELEEEINRLKPTHVISLIGRTHGVYENREYKTIDYLEQPGKLVENVRDNLFSPIVLGSFSKRYNFHLTYLGTGCIFEYDNDHPFGQEVNGFTEESVPNYFGSSYSIVKGFTDRLMHILDYNVLNVRIRMPITDEINPRNFITKITTYAKICSVPNSMTVLNNLLPIMIDMSKNKVVGTINLTNPGLITHNEILEMYKEIVNPDLVWENFSIEEQSKVLASGRSNNYLDTTKLQNMYGDKGLKNIKDAVRDVLVQMKENINS